MKKLLPAIIGSVGCFNLMFYLLTSDPLVALIAGAMLFIGLLLTLLIWEKIK